MLPYIYGLYQKQNKTTMLKAAKKLKIFHLMSRIPFLVSFISFLVVIYDFGYEHSHLYTDYLKWLYIMVLFVGVISLISRFYFRKSRPPRQAWFFDGVFFLMIIFVLMTLTGLFNFRFADSPHVKYSVIILIFIRELSSLNLDLKSRKLNPALLFVLSFLGIIIIGTFLLLLPNAANTPVTFIDALFTSTSAVCVTGLTVMDTGKQFTLFGQTIILILIQLGGLGIMTFTSYFSFFFRGSSSFQNQLLLKDMSNSDKIAEVFSTFKKVILITFGIEIAGAVLIFVSIDNTLIPTFTGRSFFSLFHSISAFCNAGFSTLTNNFYEPAYRFNYPLLVIVAFLIILGGIGFPIIFNFIAYLRYVMIDRILKRQLNHLPWILNLNTRITIITTLALLMVGTIVFYFFEFNNTLSEHSATGKIITAFFGATTPRTAGFNSVDNTALLSTTVLFTIFLMWVGASPGSTGGGIKTTTFAVSLLNAFSMARGKDRIELFMRELSFFTVQRAYAAIFLSFIVIGISVLLISTFQSELGLMSILFETVSAFGTVGLSLGITSQLNVASKIVIIITMFIGRVSMLTILIAFFKKVKLMHYRYPSENVLIN